MRSEYSVVWKKLSALVQMLAELPKDVVTEMYCGCVHDIIVHLSDGGDVLHSDQ